MDLFAYKFLFGLEIFICFYKKALQREVTKCSCFLNANWIQSVFRRMYIRFALRTLERLKFWFLCDHSAIWNEIHFPSAHSRIFKMSRTTYLFAYVRTHFVVISSKTQHCQRALSRDWRTHLDIAVGCSHTFQINWHIISNYSLMHNS